MIYDLDPLLPRVIVRRLSGLNRRALHHDLREACEEAKASQDLLGIRTVLVSWAEIADVAL